MVLLNFLNLGGVEMAIVAGIFLVPVGIIVYSVIDILQTDFKFGITRWIFLLLVLFAPFLGSIIYWKLRHNYVRSKMINRHFH